MIMKSEKTEIKLVYKTKKIINLTDKYKNKNLSELFFKGLNACSEKTLAEIIFAFGEDENEKSPFNGDMNKVYDFIDEFKQESNKSYEEIYKEIAEDINKQGFFSKKMTEEELAETMNNPLLSINMEETVKNTIDKVADKVITGEFTGYKGL